MMQVTALLFIIAACLTGERHVASGRTSRAQGLSLNDWCYAGWADCVLPGTLCVATTPADVNDPGKGLCQCKPLFDPVGSPPDRCVPSAKVDLAQAECDTIDDCSKLVNTICKSSSPGGKKTCSCKDDHEADSSLGAGIFGCKPAVCTTKSPDPNAWCQTRTPGGIPGSICGAAGKCVCPAALSLIAGICVDPNNIACSPTALCPTISSGTTSCGSNSKCVCQTSADKPGALKFINGALECQANIIGNACFKETECPITATCLKSPTAAPTAKGVCACGPYKRPRSDNSKCDATLGVCCRSVRDCGMGPSAAGDKAYSCLRASIMDPLGTCGCPPGFHWDSISCKAQPTTQTCLALP